MESITEDSGLHPKLHWMRVDCGSNAFFTTSRLLTSLSFSLPLLSLSVSVTDCPVCMSIKSYHSLTQLSRTVTARASLSPIVTHFLL
jgi:hypothetical protein